MAADLRPGVCGFLVTDASGPDQCSTHRNGLGQVSMETQQHWRDDIDDFILVVTQTSPDASYRGFPGRYAGASRAVPPPPRSPDQKLRMNIYGPKLENALTNNDERISSLSERNLTPTDQPLFWSHDHLGSAAASEQRRSFSPCGEDPLEEASGLQALQTDQSLHSVHATMNPFALRRVAMETHSQGVSGYR